jgi:hypothetical protein
MKKRKFYLLTIFLLFSISASFAQTDKNPQPPVLPIDSTTKLITYREVVVQKGTVDELFQRAMDWITAYYKNTAEVIKSSDKATGVIEGTSKIKIHTPAKDGVTTVSGIVNYNFTIAIKEGKYRFTFIRFSLKDAAYNPIEKWFDTKLPTWYPRRYEHLREVDAEILITIASLKEAMKPKAEKQDNW